eukprot:CAMPEP_0202912970 /NCGR_PEP_ID=MMETSP1392-20130828/59193_1 /ASSEMBLY_ACC=CAM_ASM_000868 /TAXON_ID=225041 /ORGANISM="Chlamydomonas chlamydogama, Strain SAG 11-48b" /LENGTH=50 /DNA_ID=CAMNT_0049604071 /DNA_START=1 /DNA_END=150 /DNA_ORIENTATION=+
MVMPTGFSRFMSNCNWAGLATTGMWGTESDNPVGKAYGFGYVWIAGDSWS